MTPRERLRLAPIRAIPFATSLLAIVAAFVVGGLFLELRGKDALGAYEILFRRGLGTNYGITETLIKMAPTLIVGAGLLIALRAGVWNIGIDGQLLVGAMLAGVVGAEIVGDVPDPLLWLLAALAGFLGGLLWAVVPGLLRVRFGLNEIITTLMMNYVALNLTSYLVKGPIKDPKAVPPQTKLIPKPDRLPDIPGLDVHIGLLVGIVVVLVVAALFRYTVLGYMLDVLGKNRRAAVHAGMPVRRLTMLALLLSGGFAGLAGANDVLGVKGLFQGNWNPGYGFMAFALVYLARLHSLLILPFAYFFAFLALGGEMMSRPKDIPTYYVELLEGLMLLFFAITVFLERRYAPSARRIRRDAAVGEGPVPSRGPEDHSSPSPRGSPAMEVSTSGRWEGTGPSPTAAGSATTGAVTGETR